MASRIIEKVPHNKVGKAKDNELIELSWQQLTPGEAQPEVPAHGQHGNSKADHRKLLQKAGADRGKSPLRKPE